jgi:glycosyltransferase involved in cell wall biosynthesis
VDDVRPYLEQACVYVAPIRYASGLQNKILEALAMEVPVVTTPIVVDGLRGGRGGEPPVRTAEAVDEVAASILTLLEDDGERRRLAADGRRFVEAEFDWSRGAGRLEAMCLTAIGEAAVVEEYAPA